jgi:hypothetical protein
MLAYASCSPTDIAGPEVMTAKRTSGDFAAARGMIQPAWLPPT